MVIAVLIIGLAVILALSYGVWLAAQLFRSIVDSYKQTLQQTVVTNGQVMSEALEHIRDISQEAVASSRASITELANGLNPPLSPSAPISQNYNTDSVITDDQIQEVYDKFDWTDTRVGGQRPDIAPLAPGQPIPGIGELGDPDDNIMHLDIPEMGEFEVGGDHDLAGEQYGG